MRSTNMKNFLIFLLGLLINALYMYVLFPILLIGILACLWVPAFFEFEGAVVIGIVISVLTLVVAGIIEYKLESVN